MSKNIKIIISTLLGGAFLSLIVFNINSLKEENTILPTEKETYTTVEQEIQQTAQVVKIAETRAPERTAVLEINGTRYESGIENGTSVYNFMLKLKNEGKIQFTDRYYIAMGKFIDSINGIRGNGNEVWIYYINGKKAETGVSNNKINPGDVVSWKYEKSY